MNAYSADVTYNSTALFAIPLGMTKVNQLSYQWQTWDGTAGRTVYGYLINKQNVPNVTIQISSDGVTWNSCSLSGTSWTYLDQTTYTSSWTYYVRCVSPDGSVGGTITQVVNYTSLPTISFINTAYGTGGGTWQTWVTAAGNTFTGTLSAGLPSGTVLQISVDGGLSWLSASTSGLTWSFTDTSIHTTSWAIYARILDTNSLITAQQTAKNITVVSPPSVSLTLVDGMSSPFSFWVEQSTSIKNFSGVLGNSLGSNELLQGSFDSGTTWFSIPTFENTWSFSSLLKWTSNISLVLRIKETNSSSYSAVSTYEIAVTNKPIASINTMDFDTGVSGDWITWDGSANRSVHGYISQSLTFHDTLKVSFDNGSSWITGTVAGQNWSAVDTSSHTSSWAILAKISNSILGDSITTSQPVTLLARPVDVYFDGMDFDTGASGDWITWDGSANRLVYGHTSIALGDSERVYVSFDNGTSWIGAIQNGINWYASDPSSHSSSWNIIAKVVETSTGLIATQITRPVTLIPTPNCTITSVTDVDSFWMTISSSAGKVITGGITVPLGINEQVQVSLNGGSSWSAAQITNAGAGYSFTDHQTHYEDWDIWVRIFNTQTSQYSQVTTQRIRFIADPIFTFSGQYLKGGENLNWSMNSAQIGIIYRGTVNPIYNHAGLYFVRASFDGGNSWQDATVHSDSSWVIVDATQHFVPWSLMVCVFDQLGNQVVSNYQKYIQCAISTGAYTLPSRPLNTARTNIILNF